MGCRSAQRQQKDPGDLRGMLSEQLLLDEQRMVEGRVWAAFLGSAYTDEALSDERNTRLDELQRLIKSSIKVCQQRGSVPTELDAETEAHLLVYFVAGIGERAVLDRERWTPARQLAHLDAYLRRLGVER